jgi:uncharacterized Fe-S cluster protein YjdI/CDGSH-type Zn-finger protein
MPDSARPTATRKQYHGEAVEVSFDGARCRHAAECLRGLPAVFDLSRRPWILPDGADPDDVVRVVARCPTGALRTHPITSTRETPSTPTEVTAMAGGPLLLRGELHVTGPGVAEHETRAALCSCGSTANAPYCDGSGTCVNWPRARRQASSPGPATS